MLKVIAGVLDLLKPNPDMADIRKDRRKMRLQRKQLRLAERTAKDIEEDFLEDGFLDDDEKAMLKEIKAAILAKKLELIGI